MRSISSRWSARRWCVAAAFSSLIAFRFGAPLLLLFLGIGLATGVDGLGIEFDNARLAYFAGSLALAVILFDSGFGTPLNALRQAAGPALSLATVGVLLTTGLFGAAAYYLTRSHLAGILPARRRRRLDRRGGGVLPAARRRDQSARPRALDARSRIRHQRPDRHLPDHHAGRGHRRRRQSRGRGAGHRPRPRLLRSIWASAPSSACSAAWPSCASSTGSISTTACCRSSC